MYIWVMHIITELNKTFQPGVVKKSQTDHAVQIMQIR